MFQRYIPELLRHTPRPGARGFAVLAGTEAIARGMLISVFPIVMYRAYQDSSLVSGIYFTLGLFSMCWGLLVPWLVRWIPRRWLYTAGALFYVVAAALVIFGEGELVAAALCFNMAATVTVFVCFNAYVLDYVASADLGRCETLRLFYSAASWTLGPAGGVWLLHFWEPAPFLVAGGAALALLVVFWWMRLGNGKLITRARAPTPNPIAYLGRFFAQPRLVAGWLFAVFRSAGWWTYVVYVPVFAIENGLGEQVGGIALSLSNAMLFASPLMLRWVERRSVRFAVRTGFLCAGTAFIAAGAVGALPWATVLLLMAGSTFLVLLDICGGLPFLMAVKPSERTDMAAVYSSFRDVSGILSPGVAWLVLLVAPVSGIFAATGLGLLASWMLAGRLNPRLGWRMAAAAERRRAEGAAAE
ncbi:MFS transporter [Nisaea sediminum]|uniref:MFS transporter n=1 Tax=Nisaea sediminum TaxID=2775867 RepID=UPI001865BEB0|nr:MFS transporter [Nisaea sediminum]